MQNKAVVVWAVGVIGRYIVERLIEEPEWQVVGLSRRKTSDRARYRHIAVDLLDVEDRKRKLAELTDVTHVFYAAFQAAPGSASNFASNTRPNRDMLVNSVTAVTRAAPHLKRVVLVTGTKYYGVHLGPVKTPMREGDPRHMPPNYYFDQIDWLTAYQKGKEWDWVELRPQTLCGFAPGSPMSWELVRLRQSNGKPEPIKCRASYDVLDEQNKLQLNIHCASESYKFDLRGSATYAGDAITGSWSESTRNAAGTMSGKVEGAGFQVVAKGPTFAANLSLMTRGDKQSVTIKSQDAQAEVQGATINLPRG
jgi:hypothetical protein